MPFTFDAEEGKQDRYTADAVKEEALNESGLEQERAAEARAAGVRDARFIGYAEVLELYNNRSDTEPLADRRARALATDPGQQSFTRAAEYTGNSETTETQYPADGEWEETDHSGATAPEEPVDPDENG